MINELTSDNSYRPKGTYIFALCCLMITAGTLMFENLEFYYGARESGGIPFLVRLTVPFQHGFNEIPRIVHLVIMIILFVLVARPVEKVLGTFRFMLFSGFIWAAYVIVHRLLEMQGHGFHPFIWSYSVVLWYILGEAKFLKTRSSYQENYRLLRAVIGLMWIGAPIMMMFIPLHFDNSWDISLLDSLWRGNILHILALIMGILGVLVFKGHIRKRLLSFTRKKKLNVATLDTITFYVCLTIPLFLLAIVYIKPT